MPDHLPHEKAPNSLKLRAFADRTGLEPVPTFGWDRDRWAL